MKKKLNFLETGTGCGQSFILIKSIMVIQWHGLIVFPSIITSMIKFFYYFVTFNKFKKKIYIMRFLGLLNSMFGKKSWYRPQI